MVEVDRFATARLDEEQVVGSTIGIINLAAKEPRFTTLLSFDSHASYPGWLPGGDLIVFVRPTSSDGSGDAADLWTVGLDGSNLTQVTFLGQEGGRAIQPSWSPDGSLIVFVPETIPGKDPAIGTISPDGTGLKLQPETTTRPRRTKERKSSVRPPMSSIYPSIRRRATRTAAIALLASFGGSSEYPAVGEPSVFHLFPGVLRSGAVRPSAR